MVPRDSLALEIYFKLLTDAQADGTLITRAWLERYPRGIAWLYATLQLEHEVYNGGFHQYFWNNGGALLDVALAGYERFECPRHIELARKAARTAGRELSPSGAEEFSDPQRFLSAFSDSAM